MPDNLLLRSTTLFALLLYGSLFGQRAQAQDLPPSDSFYKALTASENDMFRVVTEGDKPAADKLFAPDYITINADGVMENKAAVMATFGKFKGSTYRLSDRKIRVSGNIGVINGRAKFYIKSALVAEVFYTELWIFRSGEWQFLGWQGTMTGAPSYYPV